MKKIVSIMLALALVLTSAVAASATFTAGVHNEANGVTITAYPSTDYTDSNSPIRSLPMLTLNNTTLDTTNPYTLDSRYTIGAYNVASDSTTHTKLYYLKTFNNANLATNVNGYYYENSDATYTGSGSDGIVTFHYKNVGTIDGSSIDMDIRVDSLIVRGGYSPCPGVGFFTISDTVSQCAASNYQDLVSLGKSTKSGHPHIYAKFTMIPKYHNSGEVVRRPFVFNAWDMDYHADNGYDFTESFAAGSGFTNDYYVFTSTKLDHQYLSTNTDYGSAGYVYWSCPSTVDGVQDPYAHTECGVYAKTSGEGSFSFTISAMSYGTVMSVSADASTVAKKYNVSYDPNGGTFSDTTTTSKFDAEYDQNATVTVKGASNDGYLPTRTGYTFTGWNTAANGSGTARAAGSTFSMPAEDVTLYAQWTSTQLPDPPYILYYDRNTLLKKIKITDTSATHTITADPIATGAESGLTGIVDGLPTREGWLFAGWYTSAPAAVGRTAGDAYPRSFTISTYQSSASDNVELYAGWVPVSDVTKDANDEKNYGVGMTTLGGFSMQGVQVRSPELAEIYQPENKNTVNPGIRFVTVYNKTMLNQLGSLKPQAFTRADGDIPVYESGAVRYGYVLTANLTGLTDLKWNSSNAIKTDCTKSDHNRDHRNFGSYILSTTVIKFDDSGDISNYGSRLFEARAFVTYTDCNGYQRVRYSTYDSSKFAGGCRTCYNDANEWAQLHRV